MPTFEVVENPEVARIVQFSTGQLNPETKDTLDFKCYKDKVKSNKTRKLVRTELNNIKYTGQNYGSSNHFSTDNCDYYIAIHRKKADKIQVLPAELFHMKPQLEELKVVEEKEDLSGTFKEKRKLLIAQFGSGQMQKRVKKSMESKMEDGVLKLVSQSLPKPVSSQAASSPTATSTKGEPKPVESCVVPPHNINALHPQDVYTLETIIPSWAMEALKEQSQEFINSTSVEIAKWSQEKSYPPLVLNLLSSVPLGSKERPLKCSMIMYLHCLMHCYLMKSEEIRRKSSLPPWKGYVKKLVEERFTVETTDRNGRKSRSRPPHLKDLLLSHILILYMKICCYTILLKPLMVDLKLQMKRLSIHAQTLGFKIKSDKKDLGESISAFLTVPFKLASQKVRSYKKRL